MVVDSAGPYGAARPLMESERGAVLRIVNARAMRDAQRKEAAGQPVHPDELARIYWDDDSADSVQRVTFHRCDEGHRYAIMRSLDAKKLVDGLGGERPGTKSVSVSEHPDILLHNFRFVGFICIDRKTVCMDDGKSRPEPLLPGDVMFAEPEWLERFEMVSFS